MPVTNAAMKAVSRPLEPKVSGVEAAGSVRGDRVARKEQEADDGRAHARDEVDLVVLGQIAVLSVGEVLGCGGSAGDGQDTHGVVVALPQGVVDVIGPVETPDVGDRGYQAEMDEKMMMGMTEIKRRESP